MLSARLRSPITISTVLSRSMQRCGQRGDPVYAHLLYENLGNLYMEKERYQDAALAYEAFAKRRPDDRFAPSLQVRTIEAYQKGGFASLVLEGKQAFVERYAFGSPFWQQRTVADAPEVAALLKSNQKDLAEYYHAQAQKSKKPEDFTAAARWYRAMLDSFPQDAEAPGTRYLLAEVLFESGRFAEAAKEYERTAYDYPQHAKSAAAGYAALVAYQKHEPTITGESQGVVASPGHRKRGHVRDELPRACRIGSRVDEGRRRLVRVERFRSRHRGVATDSRTQAGRGAAISAHGGDLARALPVRSRSLCRSGDTPMSACRATCRRTTRIAPAIEERIAASIYKQAEAKQQTGDANGAVDDFLRVAALAPNSKVRANAEFDAASILMQNKQWDARSPSARDVPPQLSEPRTRA